MEYVMSSEELNRRIKTLFPRGEVATDNDGQIIIYTGLMASDNDEGTIIPFEERD